MAHTPTIEEHGNLVTGYDPFGRQLASHYQPLAYYDPVTGQYLSEDPAETDPNLYRYVENNPVIQTVKFEKKVTARFAKFVARHAVDDNSCVAICELGLVRE